MRSYSDYQEEVRKLLTSSLDKTGSQPILFLGSGFSRRYFDGPTWVELLGYIKEKCPLIDKDVAFYIQEYSDPAAVGEFFAKKVREWAWGGGKARISRCAFFCGR